MTGETEANPPPTTEVKAMQFMVQMQRCVAFNVGYTDVPLPDLDLPPLTWQELFHLYEVEYELLNEFIVGEMRDGRIR